MSFNLYIDAFIRRDINTMQIIKNQYENFWEVFLEYLKNTHEKLEEKQETKTEIATPPPRFGWSPEGTSELELNSPRI